jgi:hypothetical protein
MTRTIRTAVSGIAIILALASCDVLFMGVFPSSLSQATARADLSSVIGQAGANTFNVSIARSYGFEFVILSSSGGFDPTRPHVIVLSPALEVLNTYSLADMAAAPYSFSFSGGSAFAHLADGHIVIGNFDGQATSAGLKLVGPVPGAISRSTRPPTR